VISMNVVADMKSRIFVLTERGLGKMSNLDQYRLQTRGGSGIKAVMVTAKTGKVIGSRVIAPGEVGDILMISRNGQMLRIDLADVPLRGRVTQGVYIMRFKSKEDVLASFSVVPKEE